jgi:hypothetical protein
MAGGKDLVKAPLFRTVDWRKMTLSYRSVLRRRHGRPLSPFGGRDDTLDCYRSIVAGADRESFAGVSGLTFSDLPEVASEDELRTVPHTAGRSLLKRGGCSRIATDFACRGFV